MNLDWKAELIPGCFFLTVEHTAALYGRIVSLRQKGMLWVLAFHEEAPQGLEREIHYEEVATPLSTWQFQEAKRNRWSADVEVLSHILNLPPD